MLSVMKAKLTVVLFQEGSQWVAQSLEDESLEDDFAAQGHDLPDALEALAYLLRADAAIRQTIEPDAALSPVAPKYYFNMLPEFPGE